MGTRIRALMAETAPWRQGISWWVVGVEGLALAAIGLALVYQSDATGDVARVLVGIALMVLSVQELFAAVRDPNHAFRGFHLLRGVIGLATGLLVALNPWLHFFTLEISRLVLGLGLLIFGVIGLVGVLYSPTVETVSLEAVVSGSLTVAFGIVILAGGGSGSAQLLGWGALLGGLGLVLYAIVLLYGARRRV